MFANEGCGEDNEGDWDLPPKFDDYKDEQQDNQEESEEEEEENVGHYLEETLEEIVMKADEGEMLTLGTNHPAKSREHLSLFLNYSEPLLKACNSEIRSCKEWV